MTDFDTRAWLDAQPEERRRIWSSVEWGLWGSGLGDVLREPVAATMVDALSDDQVANVWATMAAWQEHKAKQGSHPGWEELARAKAEIERLRAATADKSTRPSVHPPLTKSYAIDQITDIEHLRKVAHRMWDAFSASHQQTAHVIGVLLDMEECGPCDAVLNGDAEVGCDRWREWQSKVTDGFGSV